MKTVLSAALVSALLSGCTSINAPAEVLSYQTPDDPQVGIRSTRHENILGDYNHRDVVEPKPWRGLNDSQAPNSGGGS